jgi:hypothetical protein
MQVKGYIISNSRDENMAFQAQPLSLVTRAATTYRGASLLTLLPHYWHRSHPR